MEKKMKKSFFVLSLISLGIFGENLWAQASEDSPTSEFIQGKVFSGPVVSEEESVKDLLNFVIDPDLQSLSCATGNGSRSGFNYGRWSYDRDRTPCENAHIYNSYMFLKHREKLSHLASGSVALLPAAGVMVSAAAAATAAAPLVAVTGTAIFLTGVPVLGSGSLFDTDFFDDAYRDLYNKIYHSGDKDDKHRVLKVDQCVVNGNKFLEKIQNKILKKHGKKVSQREIYQKILAGINEGRYCTPDPKNYFKVSPFTPHQVRKQVLSEYEIEADDSEPLF
jgi:hypothetical protein